MVDKVIQNMERYAWLLMSGFLAFVAAAYVGSLTVDTGSTTESIWLLAIWGLLLMGAVVVVLTVIDVLMDAFTGNSPIYKGVQLLKTNQELIVASALAFVASARIGSLTVDAASTTPAVWLAYMWLLLIIGFLIMIGVAVDTTLDFLFTSFIGSSLKRLREHQRLLVVGFVGAIAPAYIGAWTVDSGTSTPIVWLATMWISLAVAAIILVSVFIDAAFEVSNSTIIEKFLDALQANRLVALASFLAFVGAAFIGSLTVDIGTDTPVIWLAAMWIMLAAGAVGIVAVVVQTALWVSGQSGPVVEPESIKARKAKKHQS